MAQEPTPNTFVDVPVPQMTGWNDVNYLNVEPGIDGYSGASARTQIYTSEAAKQAAETAIQTDPNASDIEDALWTDSPAAVYYALDDGSGRAPGIQVVTDDFAFPTNNCIMASGERVDEELGTVVPKTCSDPASSSKRYFLEVRTADTPIDMVFDIGLKDIRYGGVKDPVDDGGEALAAFREEFGIGRIYRVIQKVINNTDERWVGVNVELGHGVGADFERFNFAEDGVAFELRNFVPREFFEGETGAPDIEVWQPERYATFSPKLFDDGSRDRFDPGFFDDAAGGLFPPQDTSGDPEKSPFIFSGTDANLNGSFGAITPNHFSMADAQAMGSTVEQGVFGYVLPDLLAPYVIARYDEGNPEGESDALEAWWDGSAWRYGLAGDASGLNPFGTVPDTVLEQWAAKLLGIDPGLLGDSVRYDSILGDDFATQNMDVYIYISEGILDDSGVPKFDNLTLRVTGVSTAEAGLATTDLGNNIPSWIDERTCEVFETPPCYENNFAPLVSFLNEDAPVALNDLATTVGTDPVDIEILGNDILRQELLQNRIDANAVTVVVNKKSDPTNGTVEIVDGVAEYTANADFSGSDSFTYSVTVTDADGGDGVDFGTDVESNTATVTIQVDSPPVPDAPVAANDSAVTFFDTPVTIDVLANDTLPEGAPTIDINNLPSASQGTAVVENGAIVFTPNENYTAFDVPARFTYQVTVNDKVSNSALVTVRIDDTPEIYVPPAEPSDGDGGLFGCSYNPGAPFDPTLPLLALAAIAGLAYRKRSQA
ncbi:choice-of-anchor F family protein [Marinobacter sp. es.042]|uniref:choice-of-anchor F family protein n=1 Tax=Marinobacter sp. es.042 TaxID=1761794 RepID=UPI000B50A851|nr:choice-of-anchor F family protein [Marinobacter sp. es.042]